METSKTRPDARSDAAAKVNQDSKAETGRESRSVPSGNAGPHDGSEMNAAVLNATHTDAGLRDGETRAAGANDRPEEVAMRRTEQTKALGDVRLPGDDEQREKSKAEQPGRDGDTGINDPDGNVDRDGDFRKPAGVEGGRVADASLVDDEQRAADKERVNAARMPAVGSAEGANSIFPPEILRAAYAALKDEVPSLSWDKFNRALQQSAKTVHNQGHPVTDEDGTG